MAAIALVALISTGCANAPAGTGSASGEKAATEGSPRTGPDSNAPVGTDGGGDRSDPPGAAPSPAELQELLKKRREFATCMRENGVEDFPDPDANGIIQYYGDAPDLKSVSEKCDDVVAKGWGR